MNGEHSTMERQKNFIVKVLYWMLIAGGILLGYKYILSVLFPFEIAFLELSGSLGCRYVLHSLEDCMRRES